MKCPALKLNISLKLTAGNLAHQHQSQHKILHPLYQIFLIILFLIYLILLFFEIRILYTYHIILNMPVVFKPLSATLLKDKDLFGKQDPYVIIEIGEEKQESSVCKSGGVEPVWADEMTFNSEAKVMKIIMYDQDLGKDDHIGQAQFDFSHLYYQLNQNQNETIELTHKGKPAGQFRFQIEVKGVNW